MEKEKQCVEKASMRLNELPTDILVDMLSRLPEKSLCRFTCVSKEWHSLISSPHPGFVKDLRRQRLRQKSYLYFWKSCRRYRFGYWGLEDYLQVSVVDAVNERIQDNYCPPIMDTCVFSIISCHNLLCLVGVEISIINLSTQKKVILPDSGYCIHIGYGFGYSSVAEEFKIVLWLHDYDDLHHGNMMCGIFSLTDRLVFKSNSWRFVNGTSPDEFLSDSVSVNGMIFWLIYDQTHEKFLDTNSIIAFDLDEEESKIISCPMLIPGANAYLIELKECLCLAHCWKEKAIVQMWRLDDPKNSVWVSEYYINFPSICDTNIVPLTSVLDLAGHVEKLVFLSFEGGGLLLYYNVESGTMRKADNMVQFILLEYEIPCVLKNIEF